MYAYVCIVCVHVFVVCVLNFLSPLKKFRHLKNWRTLGKEEIWMNLWKYLLGSRELRDLPSSIQEGLGTTHNRTQPPRTDTLCLGLVMWCYQSALVLGDLNYAWWCLVGPCSVRDGTWVSVHWKVLLQCFKLSPRSLSWFFGGGHSRWSSRIALQCMEDHMGCWRSILGQLHVGKSPTNCVVTLALT